MDNPVILSAVRTPVGKFLGTLSSIPATDLGAKVVAEAVRRAAVEPSMIDEVIMGNVVGAGLGQNPARQASLGGGIPDSVPATTINKVCSRGTSSPAPATACSMRSAAALSILVSMPSSRPYSMLMAGNCAS